LEKPVHRYVAIGDSFTEGLGDPDVRVPGGLRGWADRFAEHLANNNPGLLYANLAVRGKFLDQIDKEQAEAALALRPDLVSICAGGNDVTWPGTPVTDVARRLEDLVIHMQADDAAVILFTGPNVATHSVLRFFARKVRAYNQEVRAIAARTGAVLIDLEKVDTLAKPHVWDRDRLHLNRLGHIAVANHLADDFSLRCRATEDCAQTQQMRSAVSTTASNLEWFARYFIPWSIRGLRGKSVGDGRHPKRPTLRAVS
jgi:lysophospholipase L1-like esterase